MAIYKYLTLTSLLRIIDSGRIRFTQAAALNDPFECYPCLDLFKESLRDRSLRVVERNKNRFGDYERMLGESAIPFLVEDHVKKFINDLQSDYPMLCLTTERNNLLMWAHYSDSHGGCVIGFDDGHEFFNRKKPSATTELMKVRYLERRYILPRFEECMERMEIDDVYKAILLAKSKDWEYEHERRMFAKPNAADFRGRDGKGLPLYLYDLPSECVTEVVFGHRVSREDIKRVADLVRSKYPRARLFVARPHTSQFDLDITPLH